MRILLSRFPVGNFLDSRSGTSKVLKVQKREVEQKLKELIICPYVFTPRLE